MTTLVAFAISASVLVATPQPSAETPVTAPTVSACCEADLDRAHALRVSGDASGALRAYRAIVREQQAAGEFPGEALWQIAEIEYARERYRQALRTMDELARLAGEYGQPSVQVRALLVSAMIHTQSNRHGLARDRIERIDQILASPDVSAETRAWVEARLPARSA